MVKLKHERDLLQKIAELDRQQKIFRSVGLDPPDSKLNVEKLIRTTGQRLNATEFYLEALMNTDYANYLGSPSSSSEATEWEPLLGFSDSDLRVQIDLLNRDTFPLMVFILLNGFFSNLVSCEDCLAKIINIVYDLISLTSRKHPPSNREIRPKLEGKIPTGELTRHLCAFHAGSPRGNTVRKGYFFNVAREIRNQLTHDDITDIVDFPSPPPVTLSGFDAEPDLSLRFNAKFFDPNPAQREMVVFCRSAFNETVDFVDECYRLIYRKLLSSGGLPV